MRKRRDTAQGRRNSLNTQELTWILGSLSAVFRKPFNPDLLARQFPPPLANDALTRGAVAVGLRVEERSVPLRRLAKQTFPFLVLLRVQTTAEGDLGDGLTPAIVLQADDSRVLLVEQLYRAWSLMHNHPYHRE